MAEFYESSLSDEKPASLDDVSMVYGEAGIVLPGSVVKQLEDVEHFHGRVIANRRGFLEGEIKRLNRDILEREEQIRKDTEERTALLSILKTHGALDEYTKMQQRLTRINSRLEETKTRIDNLKIIERKFWHPSFHPESSLHF